MFKSFKSLNCLNFILRPKLKFIFKIIFKPIIKLFSFITFSGTNDWLLRSQLCYKDHVTKAKHECPSNNSQATTAFPYWQRFHDNNLGFNLANSSFLIIFYS